MNVRLRLVGATFLLLGLFFVVLNFSKQLRPNARNAAASIAVKLRVDNFVKSGAQFDVEEIKINDSNVTDPPIFFTLIEILRAWPNDDTSESKVASAGHVSLQYFDFMSVNLRHSTCAVVLLHSESFRSGRSANGAFLIFFLFWGE